MTQPNRNRPGLGGGSKSTASTKDNAAECTCRGIAVVGGVRDGNVIDVAIGHGWGCPLGNPFSPAVRP